MAPVTPGVVPPDESRRGMAVRWDGRRHVAGSHRETTRRCGRDRLPVSLMLTRSCGSGAGGSPHPVSAWRQGGSGGCTGVAPWPRLQRRSACWVHQTPSLRQPGPGGGRGLPGTTGPARRTSVTPVRHLANAVAVPRWVQRLPLERLCVTHSISQFSRVDRPRVDQAATWSASISLSL